MVCSWRRYEEQCLDGEGCGEVFPAQMTLVGAGLCTREQVGEGASAGGSWPTMPCSVLFLVLRPGHRIPRLGAS